MFKIGQILKVKCKRWQYFDLTVITEIDSLTLYRDELNKVIENPTLGKVMFSISQIQSLISLFLCVKSFWSTI